MELLRDWFKRSFSDPQVVILGVFLLVFFAVIIGLGAWLAPMFASIVIAYLLEAADYAYEHRLLWAPVWHPYTHYLHDPENRALPALLEHMSGKPERFAFYTLRDVTEMMSVADG